MGGIKDYFTGSGQIMGRVATKNDKIDQADPVTIHDVMALPPTVTAAPDPSSEVDDFLASLEEIVPENTALSTSGGSDTISRRVDTQASAMTEEQVDAGLLIEFPGGPPGVDVLCLK